MGPLIASLLTASVPSDCVMAEADYLSLRRELFAERRLGGFALRGEHPRCRRALRDVLRNAPLLLVWPEAEDTCTLVLSPGPEGWVLAREGPCSEEERLRPWRKVLVEARTTLPSDTMRDYVPRRYRPMSNSKLRRYFRREILRTLDGERSTGPYILYRPQRDGG